MQERLEMVKLQGYSPEKPGDLEKPPTYYSCVEKPAEINEFESFDSILPNTISVKILLDGDSPTRSNLRIYSPGDVVSGTIELSNVTNQLMNLSSVEVTLEGEIGVIQRSGYHSLNKVIHMQDHNACNVDDNWILKGSIKDRFSFILPDQNVEDHCSAEIGSHLSLPPSFGEDFRYDATRVGQYTRCVVPGVQLLTNDLLNSGIFCSYFIQVKITLVAYSKSSLFKSFNFSKRHFFHVFHSPEEVNVCPDSTMVQIQHLKEDTEKILLDLAMSDNNSSNLKTLGKLEPLLKQKKKQMCNKEELKMVNKCKEFLNKYRSRLEIHVVPFNKIKLQPFLPNGFGKFSLQTDTNFNLLNLKIQYKPANLKKGVKLPKSITITPDLKAINFSAIHPLPIHFDDEFFTNSHGFFRSQFKELLSYNGVLSKLKVFPDDEIAKVIEKVGGFSFCQQEEVLVEHFFKSCSVSVENNWEFDTTTDSYYCDLSVPLEVNFEHNSQTALCLLPSFQNCHFVRMYRVNVKVESEGMKVTSQSLSCTVA